MTTTRAARVLAISLLIGVACVACDAAQRSPYKTRNVVIVVIDGVRYTEGFGDPKRANHPYLNKYLVPQGVLYTNFRNEGKTSTNPGHVALVTGRYEAVANNGKQLPSAPTITQLFLKATRSPPTAAAVIVAKDKLHVLSNCTAPEWKGKHVATTSAGKSGFKSGYRSDVDTYKETLKIMKRDHPRLVVINFKGPDSTGHAGRWDAYLSSIKECDKYSFEIWKALQSDPFYKNKTTMIVTNDHGRHDDDHGGYKNHGCKCEGCEHMTLLAIGPDFARGKVVTAIAEQIDVAPTVGELLRFRVPQAKGKVMRELFARRR